jgi:hypothetical protein
MNFCCLIFFILLFVEFHKKSQKFERNGLFYINSIDINEIICYNLYSKFERDLWALVPHE